MRRPRTDLDVAGAGGLDGGVALRELLQLLHRLGRAHHRLRHHAAVAAARARACAPVGARAGGRRGWSRAAVAKVGRDARAADKAAPPWLK